MTSGAQWRPVAPLVLAGPNTAAEAAIELRCTAFFNDLQNSDFLALIIVQPLPKPLGAVRPTTMQLQRYWGRGYGMSLTVPQLFIFCDVVFGSFQLTILSAKPERTFSMLGHFKVTL